MKQKNQASVIKEAFSSKIPSNKEEWPSYYKERMEICAKCDKNTANGAIGSIGKFAAKKIAPQCSICWCAIPYKCWSKHEACGMEEVGQKPKWNRILLETEGSNDLFDVVNNSWEKCHLSLTENGNFFQIDMGDIPSGEKFEFFVEIHPKKPLQIHRINMCGCLKQRSRILDVENNVMEFNFMADEPPAGPYVKNIYFDYVDKGTSDEDAENAPKATLSLRLIANVIEKEFFDEQQQNT